MKKYVEKNGKTFAVSVNYSEGIMNQSRGYYLNVRPVEILEQSGFFPQIRITHSGPRYLLKEVEQKSDNAYREAVDMYESMAEAMMDKMLNNRLTDEA